MRRNDPLILGGGPAGSAAAICLAHSGARPLILERDRETGDAICGGFLSWRTLDTLATLGIERDQLGGHIIDQVRLFSGQHVVTARLPKAAIGLSRHRLDSLLLNKAIAQGAALERGISARDINAVGDVHLSDGATIAAQSLFLATGKYDVRGTQRPRDQAHTLGLRLLLPLHPALGTMIGSAIELHLFDGGYCGVLINERGEANLCMAVRKARLAAADGDPNRLCEQLAAENPALGDRLAFRSEAHFDAISAVPYGWIAPQTCSGLFRLGDQAAVIPSLAGEGTGIAIASGRDAAHAWETGGAGAAASFQRRFGKAAQRPVGLAMRLWGLSESGLGRAIGLTLLRLAPSLIGQLAGLTRINR
jgi:menaquinone-9 beta-reductase